MGSDAWKRNKVLVLEGFILVNFVFLILDIYLAHSVNRFRHWGEWIPFWFSIVAAALLAASLPAGYKNQRLRSKRAVAKKPTASALPTTGTHSVR